MKQAFSLMEVIIASSLLAVVMMSLFQVKGNNIFILEKSKSSKKQNDYINLAIDSKAYSKRNTNIYLDKSIMIEDDDIRKEFKEIKIKIKDEVLKEELKKIGTYTLKVKKYKTNYGFENGVSKNIYTFGLEL